MTVHFEIPSSVDDMTVADHTVTGTLTVDGYIINPAFTAPKDGDALIWSSSQNAYIPQSVEIEKNNVYNQELTTTNSTNILTVTPAADGNYQVNVYYRVVSATTTVTITLSFTDPSGAQTVEIVNALSQNVGSYSMQPVYIQATTAANIILTAQSSIANNLFISATLMAM